jgi:hypothetical protein
MWLCALVYQCTFLHPLEAVRRADPKLDMKGLIKAIEKIKIPALPSKFSALNGVYLNMMDRFENLQIFITS